MLLAILASLSQGGTVCANGCDYANLLDGVLLATPGETLELGDGVWPLSQAPVDRDLTIRAMNPGMAVIDPGLDTYAFVVVAPVRLRLEDVRFEFAQGRIVRSLAAADVELDGIDALELNPEGSLIKIESGGTLEITDSTFSGYMHNPNYSSGGAVVYLGGGAVGTLTGVTIDGGSSYWGGAIRVNGGSMTLDQTSISNATAINAGGAVLAEAGSDLTATECTFDGNHGGSGGAIQAADLYVLGGQFLNNSSEALPGGAIFVIPGGTEAVIDESAFYDNQSFQSQGGAIAADWSWVSLTVRNSRFYRNQARSGGAIYKQGDATGTIENCYFEQNAANGATGAGGAMELQFGDAQWVVADCTFADNTAINGGALALAAIGQVEIRNSAFCKNSSELGGGVYLQTAPQLVSELTVTNTVFDDNTASFGGGSIHADAGAGPITLLNNDFLDSGTDSSDGSALTLNRAEGLDLRNNLFGWNTGGSGAAWADGTIAPVADYDAWWSNAPADSGGADDLIGPNDVFADPMLTEYQPGMYCGDWDLTPMPDSPLLDGGDPSITDADGSPSDIGVTGGPGSDTDPGYDFYGENDNPYSSADPPLEDADGDGWVEGEDCDDTDPDVNPDAREVPNDGIDNDCDGKRATAWLGGRACDSTGGSTPWGVVGLLVLGLRRRGPTVAGAGVSPGPRPGRA